MRIRIINWAAAVIFAILTETPEKANGAISALALPRCAAGASVRCRVLSSSPGTTHRSEPEFPAPLRPLEGRPEIRARPGALRPRPGFPVASGRDVMQLSAPPARRRFAEVNPQRIADQRRARHARNIALFERCNHIAPGRPGFFFLLRRASYQALTAAVPTNR